MDYERPFSPDIGLRLHLNENTAGCSPKVLEAIRGIDAHQVAVYPDYDAATRRCAASLGVDPSWVQLTNGLDEGIWAAAAACIRGGGGRAEAVIPEPTFDMYAASVKAAGGRVVAVAPGPDLAFPAEGVLAAIGSATRVVYLCSPNNPTGLAVGADTIGSISRALPADGLLFLDEAYTDFAEASFLPHLAGFRNVVVGRTFAKALGLAALRIGCIVAHPETLAVLQRVIPPYSLNVCAIVAMQAALDDEDYRRWYCGQVAESRRLVYSACQRLGLRYWPSEANFVLVRVGGRCREIVAGMAARGIHVRDRSGEPGCAGCLRITAGVADHTRAALAALEELL
jgi:histidinol-phosphate aminotransferase